MKKEKKKFKGIKVKFYFANRKKWIYKNKEHKAGHGSRKLRLILPLLTQRNAISLLYIWVCLLTVWQEEGFASNLEGEGGRGWFQRRMSLLGLPWWQENTLGATFPGVHLSFFKVQRVNHQVFPTHPP
jgi:hypothetical protein